MGNGATPGTTHAGFHHLTLNVQDVDSSVKWYGEVLGFEPSARYESEAFARVILRHPDSGAVLGINSNQNTYCNGGNNDGFASVNVSGGVPPYTYSWSPNSSTAFTASGLTAGSYTATVWDATNCYNLATVRQWRVLQVIGRLSIDFRCR